MLAIRLSRIGHENSQKFRLIVQEKTCSPKSGKVVAIVGHYNPADPENKLVFEADKIETFLKNGAAPSDTVARLLLKNGFKKELVEKFVQKYTKQKPRKAPAEEEKSTAAPAAEAKSAEPTAEEKPVELDPAEEREKEPAAEEAAPEKPTGEAAPETPAKDGEKE